MMFHHSMTANDGAMRKSSGGRFLVVQASCLGLGVLGVLGMLTTTRAVIITRGLHIFIYLVVYVNSSSICKF